MTKENSLTYFKLYTKVYHSQLSELHHVLTFCVLEGE